MAGTVDVPGAGPVKKGYVYAGVGVGGLLLIMWWRNRSSSSTSSSSSPTPATGTGTGPYAPDGTTGNPNDPYSIDPATGQTYGNEGYGSGGYGGGSSGGGNSSGPPFASNAEWSQYVITYLTQNENLDPAGVGAAVGAYLTGAAVDHQQEGWIRDAIAVGGDPPTSGANGYPPAIKVKGSKQGGKTYAHNPVTGLHVTVRTTQADVRWHAAPHAASYRVSVYEGGRRVHSVDVSGTSTTLHNLRPKTAYEARVLARPADNAAYRHEAKAQFRTH